MGLKCTYCYIEELKETHLETVLEKQNIIDFLTVLAPNTNVSFTILNNVIITIFIPRTCWKKPN